MEGKIEDRSKEAKRNCCEVNQVVVAKAMGEKGKILIREGGKFIA